MTSESTTVMGLLSARPAGVMLFLLLPLSPRFVRDVPCSEFASAAEGPDPVSSVWVLLSKRVFLLLAFSTSFALRDS